MSHASYWLNEAKNKNKQTKETDVGVVKSINPCKEHQDGEEMDVVGLPL